MDLTNNLNIYHIIDDFYYNSNFNVLIYKKCEYCVTNSGLNYYLRINHNDLSLNIRKNIIEYYNNYDTLN